MKKFSEIIGWGNNHFGQLGLSETSHSQESIPRIYTFQIEISSLSCGNSHTLILSSAGYVYSFGNNEEGQLGLGDSTSAEQISSPSLIKTISKVSKISCGGWHSMALSISGELYTWGDGSSGCLGSGQFVSHSEPFKVPLPYSSACIQISAGSAHSAAVLTDGFKASLFTCGEGRKGQLGSGRQAREPCFGKVFDNVLAVACGYDHTALITQNYKLWVCGSNENGQIGLTAQISPSFVRLESDDVIKVSCSNLTACITSTGKLLIAASFTRGLTCVKSNLVVADLAAGNNFCILVDSNRCLHLWEAGKVKCFKNLTEKNVEKVAAGPDFFLAIAKKNEKKGKKNRNFSMTFERPATCRYSQREFFPKENSFRPFLDEGKVVNGYEKNPDIPERTGHVERLDSEKHELRELVENLQKDLEKLRTESRIFKQNKEKELNDLKNLLENSEAENRLLREESTEMKNSFIENEKLRINLRSLTKENQELIHLTLKLETEFKSLHSVKNDALQNLERLESENDELKIKVSELTKANHDLVKEIEEDINSQVRTYKKKTMGILNGSTVTPLSETLLTRQLTPQKENLKTKLAALQSNRVRFDVNY
jgi:alpha-tubulin suppressor-like RCC1 family protein